MAQQQEPAWAARIEEGQRDTLMLLSRVAATLERLVLAIRAQEEQMSDLGQAVDDVATRLTTLGEAIQTEIQQLADQIAAGQDVTAQIDRLRGLSTDVQTLAESLAADDPAPPPAP